MDLERAIYKKRSIIGYDQKEVREYLVQLQEEHTRELEFLKQKIHQEKERNSALISKLKRMNQLPESNPIAEELTQIIMNLFVLHNESIMNLKKELIEQENALSQILETKNRQLVSAQVKVQNALQYLRTIPNKLSEPTKELKE